MGTLSTDLEIVEPVQILENLKEHHLKQDENLTFMIDLAQKSFEKMRDLQIDLQAKLVLTNHPPSLWREEWNEEQLEVLRLHDLFFHPENSFHAVTASWSNARRKITESHERSWEFLMREMGRMADCIIRLTHRFYVVENEINARNRDILIAYKLTKDKYEFTLNCLTAARRENFVYAYIRWTGDKVGLFFIRTDIVVIIIPKALLFFPFSEIPLSRRGGCRAHAEAPEGHFRSYRFR